MSGQHVGAQSDSLVADPALEAARAAQRAAAEAMRPRARDRKYRIGDGDVCPIDAEHGQMFVLQGHPPVQYCPDQCHDGVWLGGRKGRPTRNRWPLHTFEAAVKAHRKSEADDLTPPATLSIDISAMEV